MTQPSAPPFLGTDWSLNGRRSAETQQVEDRREQGTPLHTGARPAGFIPPCQPALSDAVPSGRLWLHEIKHDGYRILARKEGDRIRLWSRNGRDWSPEFTAITEALRGLPDCIIDGEACAHCEEGWPDFWQLRGGGCGACLFAFDLLMFDGEDWRRRALLERKVGLKRLLGRQKRVLRYVEHMDDGGAAVFEHACRLGLEGIVSKRRDARYRSGRSLTWLKIKNPTYERRSQASPGDNSGREQRRGR